jgi:hypothetical protein
MIIHSHGRLLRRFIHTNAASEDGLEEPAMFLYRKAVKGKSAIIPLAAAYKYDEAKTKAERFALLRETMNIAEALDYPLTGQSCALIAATIQDGLDDLIKMPSRLPKQTQYHGEATINGTSFDVKI